MDNKTTAAQDQDQDRDRDQYRENITNFVSILITETATHSASAAHAVTVAMLASSGYTTAASYLISQNRRVVSGTLSKISDSSKAILDSAVHRTRAASSHNHSGSP